MPKVSQAAKALSSAQSAYIGSSKGIAESELNIKNIEDTLALDIEDLGKKQFAASLVLSSLDSLGVGDALEGQEIIQEEAARESYSEGIASEKQTAYESYIKSEVDPTGDAGISTDISESDPFMVKQFEQTADLSPSWDEYKATDAGKKYIKDFKATSTKQGLFGELGATAFFSPKKYGDEEFTYKQARKTGKMFGEGSAFGDKELFSLLENRMNESMNIEKYPSLYDVSGGNLTPTFAKDIMNNLGDGDWSDLNKLWKEKGFDKKFDIDYTTFSTRYKK